ncbi:uncharacterized protein DFL_000454 [Arthrobotrys flagrans]|uniref:NB-ARC domain-containing protein n=1 Tax=Arthrobotrys flagrans TaxID=97331 RepID=A0A437AE67_ARTFL|nr:hypothetical protein DFL_000454 [Arthrobotrys flagrans]
MAVSYTHSAFAGVDTGSLEPNLAAFDLEDPPQAPKHNRDAMFDERWIEDALPMKLTSLLRSSYENFQLSLPTSQVQLGSSPTLIHNFIPTLILHHNYIRGGRAKRSGQKTLESTTMSSVTIAAAVFGLITNGTKTVEWLYGFIRTIKDAPDSMTAVATKMGETIAIIDGLHKLLESQSARESAIPPLISMERFEVTIKGIMLCFSKLEKEMAFARDPRTLSIKGLVRAKWLYHEKTIEKLIERLNSHKISLLLMIQVLSAPSHSSKEKRRSFSKQIEQTVSEDPDILAHFQRRVSTASRTIYGVHSTNISLYDDDVHCHDDSENGNPVINLPVFGPINLDRTGARTATANQDGEESSKDTQSRISHSDFQEILKNSGPYLRVHNDDPRASFISRDGSSRGVTYSIFSQQSIVTISNIAVYNLPISPSDLHNSDWYEFKSLEDSAHITVPASDPVRGTYSPSLLAIPETVRNATTRIRPATNPQISQSIPRSLSSPMSTSPGNNKLVYCYPPSFDPSHSFSLVNHDFIEREEITAKVLKSIGMTKGRQTPIVILWGGLGCGKTELALDFMNRAPHLPSGQNAHKIFIRANEDQNIRCGLSSLSRKAKIALWHNNRSTTQEKEVAMWNWLALTDDPWVLILDDVLKLHSLSELPPLTNPRGTVIVTTRLKPETESAIAIEVGLFTDTQAVAAARKYYPHSHKHLTEPTEAEFLKFVKPLDLLPVEIRAFMKRAAEEYTTLGALAHDYTRERIRKECTVEQGYRIPTHGLDGKIPLYQAMWDEFKRRDSSWDIDMDGLEPSGFWSTRRTMTDVAAFLSPGCRSFKCFRLADQYLYETHCSKTNKMGHLEDSNLPLVLAPNLSDQNTLKITKLAQASYILRMSPKKKFDTIRKIASWLFNVFDAHGNSQLRLTTTEFFRHLEPLVKKVTAISGVDFSFSSSYISYEVECHFEFIRVLHAALNIGTSGQQPISKYQEKVLVLFMITLKRILSPVVDSPMYIVPEVSIQTEEYIGEIADSLDFIGENELLQNNDENAIKWIEAARRHYKVLWNYQQAVVANKSKQSTNIDRPLRIHDRVNMHACQVDVAVCLRNQNKIQESIQCLQNACQEMESPAGCILGLFKYAEGESHLLQQNYSDALSCYEDAEMSFIKCPQPTEPHLAAMQAKQGYILLRLKQWNKAINRLESALNHIPSNTDSEESCTTRNRSWINSKLAYAYKNLSSNGSNVAALTYGNFAWEAAKSLDPEAPQLVTESLHLTELYSTWEYYENLYEEWDAASNRVRDCPEVAYPQRERLTP